MPQEASGGIFEMRSVACLMNLDHCEIRIDHLIGDGQLGTNASLPSLDS